MSRFSWWPIAIIAVALLADFAFVTNAPLAIRAPLVLGFLLFGPGFAFVRLLGARQLAIELTLAIALSLALDSAVAEGMMLAHVWAVGTALAALVAISFVGAVLQMFRPAMEQRTVLEE